MRSHSESLVLKIAREESYSIGISRTNSVGEWEILNMVEIHSTVIDSVIRRTGLTRQRVKTILRAQTDELCKR